MAQAASSASTPPVAPVVQVASSVSTPPVAPVSHAPSTPWITKIEVSEVAFEASLRRVTRREVEGTDEYNQAIRSKVFSVALGGNRESATVEGSYSCRLSCVAISGFRRTESSAVNVPF